MHHVKCLLFAGHGSRYHFMKRVRVKFQNSGQFYIDDFIVLLNRETLTMIIEELYEE